MKFSLTPPRQIKLIVYWHYLSIFFVYTIKISFIMLMQRTKDHWLSSSEWSNALAFFCYQFYNMMIPKSIHVANISPLNSRPLEPSIHISNRIFKNTEIIILPNPISLPIFTTLQTSTTIHQVEQYFLFLSWSTPK